MAYQKCVAGAMSQGHDENEIRTAIKNIQDQMMQTKFTNPLDAAKLAQQRDMMAALVAKRSALINLRMRQARFARYDAAGPTRMVDAIASEIHGINTPLPGSGERFSAWAESNALHRDYIEAPTVELEKAGLFNAARLGKLDRQTAIELGELSKGKMGKPGKSGSKEAQGIAEIWNKYQNLAKENMNKAGATIGDLFGYVAHTNHDSDKIYKAGFDEWHNFTRPLLDDVKTFNGVTKIDRFMQGIYNALITGEHLKADNMLGFKDPTITGPGNKAQAVSQDRIFHWKDAESWYDYQKQFGTGNLSEALMQNLRRQANDTALMRRWGTNPRLEFESDFKRLTEMYRDSNPDEIKNLKTWRDALQNRFDNLDGTASIPVNRLWAKVGNMVRLDESLSKLGNVLFTHLSVGMTRAAELRHHGIGFLESYGNFVKSALEGRGTGEQRELMDHLGAAADMSTHDLERRFEPDDGIPGTLSKVASTFFKWTGLTYLFNAERGGMEALLSHNMGRQIESSYGQLDPLLRGRLKSYGIDGSRWDMLRAAPDHATANGRTYLTPKAAMKIPEDALRAHLYGKGLLPDNMSPIGRQRVMDAYRSDLGVRLNAYLTDSSARGMIIPGPKERAILMQGTKPGTPMGEAARFFAQFKIWPTALLNQGLGREINSSPSFKFAATGLTHMALAGAVFGYLRMMAADTAAGKNIRDPNDPKTWMAALAQGGGFGILGDYLFGEVNRFGSSPLVSALGPAASDVDTLYQFFNKAKTASMDLLDKGQTKKDLRPDAFKFMVDHTPFANLFYVRAAINYFFLWRVQEAMSPGWSQRYARNLKNSTGQTMWLSPAMANQ